MLLAAAADEVDAVNNIFRSICLCAALKVFLGSNKCARVRVCSTVRASTICHLQVAFYTIHGKGVFRTQRMPNGRSALVAARQGKPISRREKSNGKM